MTFQRCYHQDRKVAYARTDRCDCAILFSVPQGEPIPDSPLEADDLIAKWNATPASAGVRHRAICFFPKIAVDPVGNAEAFARAVVSSGSWDRFIYWNGTNPAGDTYLFPDGNQKLVIIKQLELKLMISGTAQPLSKLDGIQMRWTNGKVELLAPEGEWVIVESIGGVVLAQASSLFIDLERPIASGTASTPEDSGALEVGVVPERVEDLPLKFSYRRTKQLPPPALFQCNEILGGKMVSSLPSANAASIVLDPRDVASFASKSQRSRIKFSPDTQFVSHFVTDVGLPVRMKVPDSLDRGVGYLHFEISSGRKAGASWVLTSNTVSFAPRGEFIFSGVEGVGVQDGAPKVYRILTGSTATEFVELAIGDVLRFHADRPGTIHVAGDPRPGPVASDVSTMFHDGTGFMTTSWLTAITSENENAVYQTQPERSPVFEDTSTPSPAEDGAPVTPLARKEVRFGRVDRSVSIPVFPWSGVNAQPAPLDDEATSDVIDYEHSFLAEARRLLVPRTEPGDEPQDDTPKVGVTPQGIIAAFQGDDFRELRFGDPNPFPQTPIEYSITLRPPGDADPEGAGKVYAEFQKALRSNDLFVVFRKLEVAASAVIKPAPAFQIRDFRFSLDVEAGGESVLIVKYYKDKSLSELLPNEALWACKKYLAKDAKWTGDVEKLVKVGEKIPNPLGKIWTDKDWQGVLILNLSPDAMPDLFEALRPGMVEKNLRVHHFGLNFLPVKSDDLRSGNPRLGSAFGLLLYQRKEKPEPPKADDKNPDSGAGDDDRKYGFEVTKLEVEFANSQIARFEAEVDASFSHLFWDKAGDTGETLHLIGAYESRRTPAGGTEDVFSLRTDKKKEIAFKNSLLEKFVITRAEFVITSSAGGRIVSFLGFSGKLTFKELLDFKLFKVESITVERLGLEFDYLRAADSFKCRFRADSIRAEIDFGGLQDSLLSILPLKFKGFRIAIEKLIDMKGIGFQPITGDFSGNLFHFAFDLELDLGFLGKLAGGKGLKLPFLFGWKSGGGLGSFGLGISFPNWNGESFEIGIQSFIAIRAEKAKLVPCKTGDQLQAIAIVLSNARLVLLGYEWPRESQLDFALFVPVGTGRKMAWALARSSEEWLRYIAAGHRILPPAGTTTKAVVTNFKNILKNVSGTDPCSLIGKHSDTNGWLVAGEFLLADLVNVWIAACDSPSLYGLRLELLETGFSADALYRQITDRLGVFSAEVGLPSTLRTFQVGAATVRLPLFGVEVYTDGGFRVDFGYPWNLDFSRSFQLEIVIFLGSGGFWFGYTSGAAANLLALQGDYNGFKSPDLNELDKFQAVSAAMAMRAGIGRSIDLGILKGEASLTVFCTLEGAIAYLKGDNNREPKLFGIRGTMGIMIHIWVEVNFLILRAKAEFCAYVLVGFEIRRVLAQKVDGPAEGRGHYYLTMPIKVFAEVGIYVHVEVWVTIGCVKVKLFDLEFRGTWHFEETIGGFSQARFSGDDIAEQLADEPALPPPFAWKQDYQPLPDDYPLEIFASLLPCVGDPMDFGNPAPLNGRLQPCVVTQLMLRVEDGFATLAKYMLGWALGITLNDDTPIRRESVINRRRELQSGDYWLGGVRTKNVPVQKLERQFKVSFRVLNPQMDPANYAALPGWPDVSWRFLADPAGDLGHPPDPIEPRKFIVQYSDGTSEEVDGSKCCLVDYLRAVTDSMLSESARVIRERWKADSASLDNAFLTWKELWEQLSGQND